MQPTEYNLFFMHPQYGTTFNVTVDGALTATEMIRNLRLSGFLPEQGQYKLARYETELQPRQTFAEIAELESGDVIRIIAPPAADVANDNVRVNLKLPFIAEFIQILVPQTFTTAQLLQLLYEKGILYRFDTEYSIKKGNISLKAEQILTEIGLKDFDLLRIYSQENETETADNTPAESSGAPDSNTLAILKTLSQQIETLQAKIEQLEAAVLATASNQANTPSNTTSNNNNAYLAAPAMELPFEPLEILVQKITKQP
jgi:hypothetical protein